MAKAAEKKPSKMGLVRKAIGEGLTDLQAIVDYCKKEGVEATKAQVSTYKSVLNSNGKKNGKHEPKRKFWTTTKMETLVPPVGAHEMFDYSAHVSSLKKSVEILGREQVRKLVELV
jgi:hypothetical protein